MLSVIRDEIRTCCHCLHTSRFEDCIWCVKIEALILRLATGSPPLAHLPDAILDTTIQDCLMTRINQFGEVEPPLPFE